MVPLQKVVVCGVGLIGGSFALALRAAGAVKEIVGVGRTAATLDMAQNLGVIDRGTSDWHDALDGADLVLLAMPVGQMEPVMQAMAPHLTPRTLVTDGGSTKQDVIAAARLAFGNNIGQFIPAHPIAGAEKSGVTAAQTDLYRDKRVILTPLQENSAAGLARVKEVWETCGAQVSTLAPEDHDGTFAAVSHLPHLLAYALVHQFAKRENSEQLFSFAASGFRDFTRIASSHPEMWRDICVANRAALIKELDAFQIELLRARLLLAKADGTGLEAMFGSARDRRDAWLETMQPSGE